MIWMKGFNKEFVVAAFIFEKTYLQAQLSLTENPTVH